jgi:autotransporter-associated beta strand protein
MVGPHQTVLRPHCWCAALVVSAMLVAAPAARAQDAWLANPASGDFNTPANWTSGAVPTGFATFDASSVTTLTFSASRNIDGFIFNSGAPAYTFNLSGGFGLRFHTDGIINNSANAPTFNVSNSPLSFDDSSTAGNAIINLNAGSVQFLGNSTAGTAQLNAAAGTTFDFTGTSGPAGNGIFSAGSISGQGNFDLGVNNRLVVGSNDLSTIVSGTISSGAITKVGAGTLTLSGSNTYAGGTALSSGALMIGNSSALGSGDLAMAPGTTLAFDSAAAYTIVNNISIAGDPIFDVAAGPAQIVSGIISDTDPVNNPGIVEKNGAGTLVLSGANTYSGGTIIDAGTLQVTNSTPGTSSSVGVGDVTLNGGTFQVGGFTDLEFSNNIKINTAGGAVDNNGTILTLSGIISNGNGTNGVLQITDSSVGLGTTVLSGANTYSGGTKVTGATLQVNNNNSVGTGLVTLENGLFQVADTILTPTLSFSNNFAINNTPFGSAIDVNGYSLTISGNIADGNGPGKLTVSDSFGGGALILTGTNTYSGGTDICNCGTLQLGTTGTMGSILGAVTNAGQFDIVNANTVGITSIFNDGGLTNFYNATTASAMTITNRFGGTAWFYDSSTAGSATIINNLGGSTEFGVQFGTDAPSAGTATITNNNFGITEFNASSTASNAKIITNSGGELDFWDTSTAEKATITTNPGGKTFFNDNSTGDMARFITSGSGFVDFSGSIGPNGDGRITAGSIEGSGKFFIGTADASLVPSNTLIVGSNNLSTEVSGVIADNNPCGCPGTLGPGALEKVGTGTLTLSGTNTYTGGTTITAGTLQLGNGIATTGSILGNVTDNATLAFNRPNSYQFDGVISGSGAVQQNGAGTTTLTAVNTYAGATTISAGTLALSGAGSIANSSGVVANGTFDISATTAGVSIKNLSGTGIVTLGSQMLTLTNASGTFAGATGGNGGLVKQGPGLFTLSGANTYLGGTTVEGGNLRVNGSVASAVTVQSGATLSGTGSVGGLVTVQSGGTLSAGQSPGTLTLGALNLNAGSTSVFELGSPGVVGGANNDLVNVTGNLTLGGTLSVNAPSAGYYRLFNYGTMTASSFGTINGSSNGTPTALTNVPNQVNLSIAGAGQRIQFWDGADQTGNGVVNGGTGTWNATNTNWTGAPGQANINDQWRSSVGVFAGTAANVTIDGAQAFDTLQFSTNNYVLKAGAGGQLQLAGLSGTGTINTDNGVNAVISVPIVNGSSQSLTKVGGGRLVLDSVNTYTGGTTISGGTLELATGGSILGNVTDNSVLAFSQSNSVTFSGTISGSGAVQQIGSGTTTLTAANTYTGLTTVSDGALVIAATGSIVGGLLVTRGMATNNNLISGTVTLFNTSSASAALINNKTIDGAVNNNSGTFTNNANGTVSGLLTNGNGLTTNNGQLNGGAAVHDGTLTNNNLISGNVDIFARNLFIRPTVNNNGTITGAVTSAGFFNNNATGIVSGLLTMGGSADTTNAGQLNGGVINFLRGVLTTTGTILNGLTNEGTVNGNGGVISGAIANQGANGGPTFATFNVAGNLAGNNTFTNSGAARLNVTAGGNFTGITTLTNSSTSEPGIVVAAGSTLSANAINNNAGVISNSGTLTSLGGPVNNAGTLTSTAATSIVNGGLINSGLVVARNQVNGAIVNQGAGTFVVGGNSFGNLALAGNSSFTNNGTAQLLVNAGNFTGITTLINNSTNATGVDVSATRTLSTTGTLTNAAGANIEVRGTLTAGQLLTNSGAILVNNGGTLNATVGGITNTATGTITVALGGTVNDDLNNIGVVTNNGAYNAFVATNTGAITNGATGVWTGNVLSSAAAITNSGVWIGTIANAGTFNNNAGGTVSGLLTNTAGTTTNNGALNGGASVSGGVFTGSGTVTNLTVSGGTFAPGNGTPGSSMTVTGNLAFQSGAMYLVTLNPATASFTNVGGIATLNGTAAAVYVAGNYISKKYTILTAAGGVNGTFGSLVNTNVPANFTSTLSYDANNAYLDLALNFVTPSGLNVNQQNVANALTNFFNTTGGIPAAFASLSRAGLTQASGELATASQQTTFDAMNLFLGLLTDPFVAGRGAPVTASTLAPQFADQIDANAYASTGKPRTKNEREAYAAVARKAPMRDTVYDPRWSVWAAGFGGSQTTDGNMALGSNTATSRVFGTAVGADYLFSPRTLAGFALAGGGTNFSVNGLGTGRSDLFQAGAFVRHTKGPAYISAALAYGWQDVTTDRTVAAAGGGQLRATFNANAFSGRLEGGYRFVTPWMAMGLTPYAAGQFTTFDLPAYVEQAITGANTFALGYASKNVTASRSELGLRSDKSFAMPDGIFTLRGRAAWAHNFNPDRNIAATFQTLPGASFVVNGAAQARDAALVTASAEMKWLNGFSLGATFEGEFSDVTRSYAGKGVVRYAW